MTLDEFLNHCERQILSQIGLTLSEEFALHKLSRELIFQRNENVMDLYNAIDEKSNGLKAITKYNAALDKIVSEGEA